MGIGIVGTGRCLPPRVVDNHEISRFVDTSDEWIVSRTGIRARRFADRAVTSSDLGAEAACAALASAGLRAEHVDAIIVATSSPDWIQPATACAVQRKVGARSAAAFDVGAVCAGFVYGLAVGCGLMTAFSDLRNVLVVGAETYSKLLDFQDRTSSVFFGDGAGAVVLGRVPQDYGILGVKLIADGRLTDVVMVPAGGGALPATEDTVRRRQHSFRMDGGRVWEYVTRELPRVVREALSTAGLDVDDVDVFVFHQANARLLEACMTGLGADAGRMVCTVEEFGNTAAASVPITLHAAALGGRLTRGSTVVLGAVGGGMTAGAAVLRWY